MIDKKTISAYDQQAEEYAELVNGDVAEDNTLQRFIAELNDENFVLDLGCGPAQASAVMRDAGILVDPVDASAEMVNLANRTYAINARQASFSDISDKNLYHGVWANFSLLHATQEEFPKILAQLFASLKVGGVLHLGMKLGKSSARDRLSRLYQYYSQDELCDYLEQAGFTVKYVEQGEALGMAGKVEPWIAILSTAAKA